MSEFDASNDMTSPTEFHNNWSYHHRMLPELSRDLIRALVLLLWIVSGVNGCKYFDSEHPSKHYQLLAYASQFTRETDCWYSMFPCVCYSLNMPVSLSIAYGCLLRCIYAICMSSWVEQSLFDSTIRRVRLSAAALKITLMSLITARCYIHFAQSTRQHAYVYVNIRNT